MADEQTPIVTMLAEIHRLRGADPASSGEWELPVPLSTRDTLPAFPVDALPEPLASFVAKKAEALRTAPDLLAVFVLPALSAVAAGRVKVEPWPGWLEPVTLHVVGVAPPGSMKSACHAAAVAPLGHLEAEWQERHGAEVAGQLALLEVGEKRRSKLSSAAANAEEPTERRRLEDELVTLAGELDAAPTPAVPRLVVTDATAEKLEQLLSQHSGRMGWISDEGGALVSIATGRYKAAGATVPLDVFLKGHSGEPLVVERIGRPAVRVMSPALTVGVAVQPSLMHDVGRSDALLGQGIVARWLIAWPDLEPVNRSLPPPAAVTEYEERYRGRVVEIEAALACRGAEPKVLRLDPDALEIARAWFLQVHAGQLPGGALESVAAWAAKLDGATMRLAGLLALAENPRTDRVDARAVTRAIALAKYFAAHALYAFGEMGSRDDIRHARTILAAIRRAQPSATKWKGLPALITRRDVFESVRGTRGLDTSEAVGEALEVLAGYGYIRRVEDSAAKGKGRPSERWEVNPATLA